VSVGNTCNACVLHLGIGLQGMDVEMFLKGMKAEIGLHECIEILKGMHRKMWLRSADSTLMNAYTYKMNANE
jgi:hypothetical protein